MIARIYREGIEDRIATFETDAPSEEDVLAWFERPHPIVVVSEADKVFAFAVSAPTSTRPCYAGNAEFSVYVARTSRGRGGGRDAMAALIDACRVAGYNKLTSRVFVENAASRGLLRLLGFRELGVYENHGLLDGVWRDVVIVERLLQNHRASVG